MSATTYYVCQAADRQTWIAITYNRGTVVRHILADVVGCSDGIALFKQRNPELTVLPADRDTTAWARAIWKARQTPDVGWSVLHATT